MGEEPETPSPGHPAVLEHRTAKLKVTAGVLAVIAAGIGAVVAIRGCLPKQTTTSATVMPYSADLQLPAGSKTFWVFYQFVDTENHPTRCEPGPEQLTALEFGQRFEEFRKEARRRGAKLVVTGVDIHGQWISGRIRYRGTKLVDTVYTFHGGEDWGAQVPLD